MLRFVGITDVRFDGQEERWIFEADLCAPEEERRVVLVSYGRKDEHGNRVAQWNAGDCMSAFRFRQSTRFTRMHPSPSTIPAQ